jgi:hypothetical protein
MSARRPTPFEGDDDPTPARGIRPADPVPDAHRDGHAHDEHQHGEDQTGAAPNYLVRRAVVTAAVVVAIAIVAIVIGWFLDDDESPASPSAEAAEWNTLVVLTDDQIRLLDRGSNDEIDTYAAANLLDAQSLVAGNVLVTMDDTGLIVQTDLTDGSRRRSRSGPDETLRISPDNPTIAIAGSDVGGDVTIIETLDRSSFSIAEVAGLEDPLIFADDVLVNPSASHIATPVPNAFQSVVIELDTQSAQARAGRAIAIDDERVVTEQPAGDRSEIEFFDLAGERLGTADIAAPRATLLRDDGRLLSVSESGAISIVDPDGSIDEVGELLDPDGRSIEVSDGASVVDGDNLLVVGDRQSFVLDSDGSQLGTVTGVPDATPATGARCVVVGDPGTPTTTKVLDLETGAVIAEIDVGFPLADSFDGCTAAFQSGGPKVFSNGELTDVDVDSIAAVAPDGAGYVAIDGRDAEYVADGDDPVEVTDRDAIVHFGQR